uniref:Uncharacterized protein n=1 Tax=Avena sativa TaxID=4498 RepID=A0ACD5U2E4_AVESA
MEAAEVRPSKQAETEEIDLISLLPDEILSTVVSFLPTKDGARTTVLSSRWRPLWRTSPLNLDDAHLPRWSWECISKILSEHRGPGRRLCLRNLVGRNSVADLPAWLRSPALDSLEVIHLDYHYELLLPASVFRFAPTLREASLGAFRFPEDAPPGLAFPHLKQLILTDALFSEDALHGLISACPALEILLLDWCGGFDRVVINSPTLRSFGVCADGNLDKLVIQDAPRLERLVAFDQMDIRVNRAPRLQMVGLLDSYKTTLRSGAMVSRGISHDNLAMSMRSVKLFVLDTYGPDLDAVIVFIRCLPCLEKIYITVTSLFLVVPCTTELTSFSSYSNQVEASPLLANIGSNFYCSLQSSLEVDLKKKNVRRLNPQDRIECLDLALKEVVVKGYEGKRSDVNFVKFFVLNAKVLELMEIGILNTSRVIGEKWKADQRSRLQLDSRASRNARIIFGDSYPFTKFACSKHAHVLNMADPVGSSCGICGNLKKKRVWPC